jgi:hypothetical protein
MRTTISIPDPYYLKIKKMLPEEGYNTVNDFLLALIRHHFDAGKHQIDAPQMKVKVKEKEVEVKKPDKVKQFELRQKSKGKQLSSHCKHGFLRRLCPQKGNQTECLK